MFFLTYLPSKPVPMHTVQVAKVCANHYRHDMTESLLRLEYTKIKTHIHTYQEWAFQNFL